VEAVLELAVTTISSLSELYASGLSLDVEEETISMAHPLYSDHEPIAVQEAQEPPMVIKEGEVKAQRSSDEADESKPKISVSD
jgi:hypothetical protein